MRRMITTILAGALVLGAFAAPMAEARKKKAKKPVATTLYLHGLSEADEVNAFTGDNFLNMDATKPASGQPKSMFVTNYVVGPNTACSGNQLVPTWQGRIAGSVKGDLTVKLHTIATPNAKIRIELFPDGNGGCNSDLGNTGYQPPVAAKDIDVPAGPGSIEAKFSGISFKAAGNLTMMVTMAPGVTGIVADPVQVRLLYDSAEYPSAVSFKCMPKGKTCTF